MINSKKIISLSVLILLNVAAAQAGDFVRDARGTIVRTAAGECWRTIDTSPSLVCPPTQDVVVTSQAAAVESAAVEVSAPGPLEVFFEHGKASLAASEIKKLESALGSWTSLAGKKSLRVVGFADWSGDEQNNLTLSQSRALTVKSLISAHPRFEKVAVVIEAAGDAASRVNSQGCKSSSEWVSCLATDRKAALSLE